MCGQYVCPQEKAYEIQIWWTSRKKLKQNEND